MDEGAAGACEIDTTRRNHFLNLCTDAPGHNWGSLVRKIADLLVWYVAISWLQR